MHHYISRRSLEYYVLACRDPEERRWKARHLMELIEFFYKYENFRYYLTDVESGFNFLLKYSTANRTAEWVFFYSHDLSLMQGRLRDQLIGFYTGNKVLVEQFGKDIEIVKACVLDEYRDPARLEKFIAELVKKSNG